MESVQDSVSLKEMEEGLVCLIGELIVKSWANQKRRNPIATDLHSPIYRGRVIPSKKIYKRKSKHVAA